MKKIIQTMFLFLLCFGFCFSLGCNNDKKDPDEKDPGETEKPDPKDDPVKEVTLKEIKVNSDKLKVQYVIGEELDFTGLVVTAIYSDNTTKIISDGYVLDSSGYKQNKIGSYRILINYTEKNITETAIVDVKVVSILDTVKYLIGIDVQPRKDYFILNTEFNTNNLVVMAIYSDGSKEDVTKNVVINSTKFNSAVCGVYEIIIDYKETYGEGSNAVTIAWDSFYFAIVEEEKVGE